MKKIILFILPFACWNCEKKELPAPAYDRGDLIVSQVDMGSNYKNQVWFSFDENRVVSTNRRTDWDLAFEASADGSRLMLNGSKGMKVFKTAYTDLMQVMDTTGMEANARIDAPSGKADSTAFGNWNSPNTVYILDGGYDETGTHQGFYKLKMRAAGSLSYSFEYAPLSGGQVMEGIVNKNNDYNVVMFSLSSGHEVYIEPKKSDYAICFTYYTHFFTNPFQYYQVAGVLQNPYRTRTLCIRDKPFVEITLADTLGRLFSTNRNAIGYDWKEFSLNTNQYTVHSNYSYIFQDSKGYFYKLHFVDFYTNTGVKGAPKFEFKKL